MSSKGKVVRLSKAEWAKRQESARLRREKLVLDHLPMVAKIAEQVHGKMTHVPIEDLIQDGYIGLIEASRRFVFARGKKFEAFAFFRVRGAMYDAHKRRAYKDDTLTLCSIDAREPVERLKWEDQPKAPVPRVIRDNRPQPEEAAATRERASLLAQAVDELPEDEREVFMLSIAGISIAKISVRVGKSIAWTRAKLATAKLALGAKVEMWGLGLDKAA